MIKVKNLSLSQGEFKLKNMNLEIPEGQYIVIMGASGSGKTTLLEAICGLRPITGGEIIIGGQDVSSLRPAERNVGYVPQDGALFPTFSVGDQMAYAMSIRKQPVDVIAKRVNELAEMLGVTHLLNRPSEVLSGGEKQRVALGRALAIRPTLLCFDEPLSALDEDKHSEMCGLLKRTVKEAGISTLHVTHSRREADSLADKIYEFNPNGLKEIQ